MLKQIQKWKLTKSCSILNDIIKSNVTWIYHLSQFPSSKCYHMMSQPVKKVRYNEGWDMKRKTTHSQDAVYTSVIMSISSFHTIVIIYSYPMTSNLSLLSKSINIYKMLSVCLWFYVCNTVLSYIWKYTLKQLALLHTHSLCRILLTSYYNTVSTYISLF